MKEIKLRICGLRHSERCAAYVVLARRAAAVSNQPLCRFYVNLAMRHKFSLGACKVLVASGDKHAALAWMKLYGVDVTELLEEAS